MATRGVSGLGLTSVVAGIVLVTSGMKNATVADTLRAMLKGQAPAAGPSTVVSGTETSVGPVVNTPGAGPAGALSSSRGSAIANDALKYVGVPYKFSGSTPSGWDCSGFVTWVLHHDLGYELPSNTHTVTGQFLVWSGATTVARNQCQAGDLVCWPGHIGIAVSNSQMVDAPHTGAVTRVENIWPGAVIRRVN